MRMENQQLLEEQGVARDVRMIDNRLPNLVNLNEDPQLSGACDVFSASSFFFVFLLLSFFFFSLSVRLIDRVVQKCCCT